MNLQEAKELFRKHHPEETSYIEKTRGENQLRAGCVWTGFKSALKMMGHLSD